MILKVHSRTGAGWRFFEASDVCVSQAQVRVQPDSPDGAPGGRVFHEVTHDPDGVVGVSASEMRIDFDEVCFFDDGLFAVGYTQAARITRPDGSTAVVAFDGDGYLLNDSGKTIETLHTHADVR